MRSVERIGLREWDGLVVFLGRRPKLEKGWGKRKKQVPPDRTRDSRHLSGARRCAPR